MVTYHDSVKNRQYYQLTTNILESKIAELGFYQSLREMNQIRDVKGPYLESMIVKDVKFGTAMIRAHFLGRSQQYNDSYCAYSRICYRRLDLK